MSPSKNNNKYTGIKRQARALCSLPLGLLALALADPAWSGEFRLGEEVSANYLLTLGYGAAMRTESQSSELINGPIDSASGLPTTINSDDGDRNFAPGSLINNRLSLLGEIDLHYHNYGAFLRASSFYDDVWQHRNDNDSPETVNKTGPADEFTRGARDAGGSRTRFLDAYVYGSFQTAEQSMLNLRLGRQVVQWGESLFFPNIAGAQSPADATKANVPGIEVKDILLPVGQMFAQWQLSPSFGVGAYYQYEYKPTELDPVGGYYSFSDMIGPGAEFLYLAPGFTLPKGPTDRPRDSGQWGVSMRLAVSNETEVSLYRLRYHDKNPNVRVNFQNDVPTDYQVIYFDDIDLTGVSFSTRLGDFNVAGEISYKDGVPVLVDTPVGASATRANATQAQLSSLYILGPRWFSDQTTFVGEVAYLRVNKVDDFTFAGETFHELSADRGAWAYQLSATPSWNNVIDGWDLSMPLSYAEQVNGTTAVAGAFGGLVGEGDIRASAGLTFKYLNNLELGMSYNAFLGGADLAKRPLADRDYLAFSAKYSL